MKKFIISLIALFAFANIYAQEYRADMPGPFDVKGNYSSVETKNPALKINNSTSKVQTDEYGWFNVNANLSLAAGQYAAAGGVTNENVDGSIEAWIYWTGGGSVPTIFAKGDATNVGIYFGIASNHLFIRFGTAPTTNTSGATISQNVWTHVAATWSGGAGNYTVTFYVNGAQSGSTSTNTGSWNITSDSATIGNSKAFFSSGQFLGKIDEVRYWDDVRTLAEIRNNRFVGLGDGSGANTGNAITSAINYASINNSWNFNTGSPFSDAFGNITMYGRFGAEGQYVSIYGIPIPYNFALKLEGGTTDFVTIPHSTIFNQTASGGLDAWIYLTTASTLNTIISKGTTFANHNFAFYISAGNKIGLNIGAHNYISNGPVVFTTGKWYHVAAMWSGGPNFTVRLYVNGQLDYESTYNLAMPTNTDPATIGKYYTSTGMFKGYIDEVRLWSTALTQAQIQRYMFNSCRASSMPSTMVAAWNFDGNLLNRSSSTGIDGSFNTGGTNNCRFSGYSNETSSGTPSTSFDAHATVINRNLATNPFPQSFYLRTSNKTILDNTTTKDTVYVSPSAALTSLEVFVAIQHTYAADLDIVLRAPNGTTRELSTDNGGSSQGGYRTFFIDGGTNVNTANFFCPFSHIAGPEVTMGNFGGTNVHGNWILEVTDDLGGFTGTLLGWGIRYNNITTGIEPVAGNPETYSLSQNYPNPFNPTTTIRVQLPKEGDVSIKVFDMLGREVSVIMNGFMKSGTYDITFDASTLASGTYFYRMQAGDFIDIKKMVVLK
ncbi:MAG: T9SS type A sorting domain-containing protein [Ignavibacteria bacterium]|nr:T9SS type A sorting domain-containing protein [Ignavibacteria bacterium]